MQLKDVIYDLKKSIQAIIITAIVGFIVPRLISLSDFGIVNKLAWKALLSGAFLLSTLMVGVLYSSRFIKGKVSGGKARANIFIIIVLILCVLAPTISLIIDTASKIFIGTILIATLVAVGFGLFKLILWLVDKPKRSNISNTQQSHNTSIYSQSKLKLPENNKSTTNSSYPKYISPTPNKKKIVIEQSSKTEVKKELTYTLNRDRTLYELAMEHDFSNGCMTVTNDENPNLKWVKIYKPWYANGKFYGYIMMNNAHNTVNGEIFFADRPIWRLA